MINPKFRTKKRHRDSPQTAELKAESLFDDIQHNELYGSQIFESRDGIFQSMEMHTVDRASIINSFGDRIGATQHKYCQFKLKQAMGLYQLDDSFDKLEFINSFIFKRCFKLIGLVLTLFQCSLASIEPVSVWWTLLDNSNSSSISIMASSIIELCIISFHCVSIFAYFYRNDRIYDATWIWWFIATVTLCSVISIICSIGCSGYLRFHRMLRPLFFSLYWMHGRWCLEVILLTVVSIIRPFLIALFSITIFSFVVFSMFCEQSLLLNHNEKMQSLAVKFFIFFCFPIAKRIYNV